MDDIMPQLNTIIKKMFIMQHPGHGCVMVWKTNRLEFQPFYQKYSIETREICAKITKQDGEQKREKRRKTDLTLCEIRCPEIVYISCPACSIRHRQYIR